MRGPLHGIAIMDLGLGPVTGLATMVLADFGAEVIKVEPPGGDPFRAMPSSKTWLRGKSTLEVDFDDPQAVDRLRSLIIDATDAVVTTLDRERRRALGLDYARLSASRPDLVYGVISGFGEDGPYRDYAAVESVVAAKFGRMMSLEGIAPRRGPCYAAVQVATHAASQSVAAAVLASLHGRLTSGRGFAFDTSLMRSLLPQDVNGVQTAQLRERGILPIPETATDPVTVMPRLYYHSVRTKDGRWIQLGNLLPHLHENFLAVAGIETPGGRTPRDGSPEQEELRNRMLETIKSATLEEWMDRFVGHGGVAAHPYQTTQAAMADPDIVANGHVVSVDGVAQLGPLADLTETPARIGGAPERIDLDRAYELFRAKSRTRLGRGSKDAPAPTRPLEGVTVIEAATIIAAPLGASILADMGARVIKFEPVGGDPFRGMMAGLGAARCNTGKESICLDLKSSKGRLIARKLVAGADILIHNYRPGVPERLGLDYENLARVKPDLVYLSANGYGRNGPGARRPSTHPIPGAALGGVVWQMGGLPPDGPLDLDEVREVARRLFSGERHQSGSEHVDGRCDHRGTGSFGARSDRQGTANIRRHVSVPTRMRTGTISFPIRASRIGRTWTATCWGWGLGAACTSANPAGCSCTPRTETLARGWERKTRRRSRQSFEPTTQTLGKRASMAMELPVSARMRTGPRSSCCAISTRGRKNLS